VLVLHCISALYHNHHTVN